jgi:DNA invertase Pin-like site-specific DNA recombinase
VIDRSLTPIRIGYARCSTAGQELGSQVTALDAAGCKRIFPEKISIRIKIRPELEACAVPELAQWL